MSKTTASGALGLAFASALGWLCCLPIATGAFGVALAALASVLGPWGPMLAFASVVLLAFAVIQTLRGGGGAEGDHCEIRNRRRRDFLFLVVIGLLTLALITLPWWSAELTYRLIH